MKKGILLLIFPFLLYAAQIDKEELEYAFEDGKRVYNETCVSCHGRDGTAKTSLNLVVRPRDLTQSILTEDQIYKIIRDGAHKWGSRSDIMPSFKSVYSDEEIKNTAFFIYNQFTVKKQNRVSKLLLESNGDDKINLKRGEKIFKRNCSLCHALDGSGNSEYVEKSKDQKNFIYPYNLQKVLLTKDQIFLYTKFGGKFWGTHKNDMPSWKRKYDDATLKSVALYIEEVIRKK